MNHIKNIFNKIIIIIFSLIPLGVMRHVLFLLRKNKNLPDRWGYHIRPIHYYEPLPDFRVIRKNQFERERNFAGIDFRLPEQKTLFEQLGKSYLGELTELVNGNGRESFDFSNTFFSGLDACLYYSLIRDLKPTHVIEIGSGYSTRIAAKAFGKNKEEGGSGHLTCIEPYPEPRLTAANLDIELIKQPVEKLDFDLFEKLNQNDILFIDSSHVARFGGDVCREILEILPRLKAGVWVHVHDIFFPRDYPSEWLIDQRLAFNEQYLLEAFLSFNNKYSVCAANYWLWLKHRNTVRKLCPSIVIPKSYMGCSSFWLRKTD